MKKVKEHIYEKFTKESDPVDDLGIGIDSKFKKWLIKFQDDYPGINVFDENSKLETLGMADGYEFVEYLIDKGANVHSNNERALRTAAYYRGIKTGVELIKFGADIHRARKFASTHSHKETLNGLDEIEQALGVNERFEEKSDPIDDMGIGMINHIKSGVRQIKLKEPLVADIRLRKHSIEGIGYYLSITYYGHHPEIYKVINEYIGKQFFKLMGSREDSVNTIFTGIIKPEYSDFFVKAMGVKESVNEKFQEVGDPVEELGIGYRKLAEKEFMKLTQMNFTQAAKYIFGPEYRWAASNVVLVVETLHDIMKGKNPQKSYNRKIKTAFPFLRTVSSQKRILKFFNEKLGLELKPEPEDKLRPISLDEKFEESGDPINDMGIGLKKVVVDWLNQYNNVKVNEDNITINKDGEISSYKYLVFTHTPNFPEYIKFNYIGGDFIMHHNEEFTSLKGFPKHITGNLKFYNNGIKPTKEQIKEICEVEGEIQLVDDYEFRQIKSREKYKKLGPIKSRPSPEINYKDPKTSLYNQKYSRGYLLWKMLDFIIKAGDKGRRYKELVAFDSAFKGQGPKRTVAMGVFNSLKRNTDIINHRYFLNRRGRFFYNEYKPYFDDGIDYMQAKKDEGIDF